MAFVTPISCAPGQVEYRLGQGHGCAPPGGSADAGDSRAAAERRFSYHADGRERPLTWIGRGLAEVGIVAGSELTPQQFDLARALMSGKDPRTGERLVSSKLAVPDDAKVPLSSLVAAIRGVASEADVPVGEVFGRRPHLVKAFDAAVRAVARSGEAARLRADEAGRLADAAGLAVEDVWGVGVYETAARNLFETRTVTQADGTVVEERAPRRIRVGNAGYDVTFTLPKSLSLLLAFADPELAATVESIYLRAVESTFAWLEEQTAYGMRGKHGDGHVARTVAGSGLLGWAMIHRAARPTGDAVVGDPHWHVHVTVANMTRGADSRWSTIAAGGRDLMRHAPVIDHLLKAQVRHELTARFGMEFARNERTGAWELAAIPDATLSRFSKRKHDIDQLLTALGHNPAAADRTQQRIAEQRTRHAKPHATAAPDATLQQLWQNEERAAGGDPDEHLRRTLNPTASRPTPVPSVTEIALELQDPDTGLTAHSRRFTRADALARVADLLPHGVTGAAELERITDSVLAHAGFVALPRGDAPTRVGLAESHMRNAEQFTTADVVDVETVILTNAKAAHPGQSPVRVHDDAVIDLAVATVEAQQRHALSGEQRAALRRLVTEGRMVDAVNGAPGTGKTTLMRAVRVVFEAAGFRVAGAATAAIAAQHLQTESGIPSATIATYLTALDRHTNGAGERESGCLLRGVDVLVIDEANLTEDRDRARLYRRAAETGTRIIEIGDAQQLRGVGVGSLFGHVHRLVGGLELVDNRRQVAEDERAAITAWRDQRHVDALQHWADQHRLTATDTSADAIAAMLADWRHHRRGAPGPHAEMRGLVMLAARNDTVRRLNTAAQALRQQDGQLGHGRDYTLPAGQTLRLHVGDHVLIRINDRGRLTTDTVLNGYRGVITHITTEPDHRSHNSDASADPQPPAPVEQGSVTVEWQLDTLDGPSVRSTTVSPAYIAAGGIDLAYAITIHKAEGLTIGHRWTHPDGHQAGGTVLVATDGADNPALHVATSRHTHAVHLYAARTDLETTHHEHHPGIPHATRDLQPRVIAALADHAAATTHRPDDHPVLAQLGRIRLNDHEVEHAGTRSPGATSTGETDARAAWETAATDRIARRHARQQRARAQADRHDRAAALLRDAWPTAPHLVDRVLAAPAMGALADVIHHLTTAGHDVTAALRALPLDTIASPTVRDPAAYTAALLDAAVIDAERDRIRAADNEQASEQAADLLTETWASHPDSADAVIHAPAFGAFVHALARHTDNGLDPHDLVAAVPARTLLDPDVRDPAALATYHLHRVAEHHRRHTRTRDDDPVDPRHLAAAGLIRDAWREHPREARHVTSHPGFAHLARRMHDAHELGHDVHAALRQLDPVHVVGDRGNPAARTTYALTHHLNQQNHAVRQQRLRDELADITAQRDAALAQAASLRQRVAAHDGPTLRAERRRLADLENRAAAIHRAQTIDEQRQAAHRHAETVIRQRTATAIELTDRRLPRRRHAELGERLASLHEVERQALDDLRRLTEQLRSTRESTEPRHRWDATVSAHAAAMANLDTIVGQAHARDIIALRDAEQRADDLSHRTDLIGHEFRITQAHQHPLLAGHDAHLGRLGWSHEAEEPGRTYSTVANRAYASPQCFTREAGPPLEDLSDGHSAAVAYRPRFGRVEQQEP